MGVDPFEVVAAAVGVGGLLVAYRTLTSDRPRLKVRLLAVRNAPWLAEGDGVGEEAAVWFAIIQASNGGKQPIRLVRTGLDTASGPQDSPHTAGSEPLEAASGGSLEPGKDFSFYWFGGLRALARLSAGPGGPVEAVWVEDADGRRVCAQVDYGKLAQWADPTYEGGIHLPFEDPSLPTPRLVLGRTDQSFGDRLRTISRKVRRTLRQSDRKPGEHGSEAVRVLQEHESRLLGLGHRVPKADTAQNEADVFAYLLASRAVSLYQSFLRLMSGEASAAAPVVARTIVEIAIKLEWASLNPTLNTRLYIAASEKADLTTLRMLEENLHVQPPPSLTQTQVTELKAAKRTIQQEAVDAAASVGTAYGKRVLPDLETMVKEIEASDPAFGRAAREAYDGLYRLLSPWDHSEITSFKHVVRENPDGSVSYIGDGWGIRPEHLRVMVASTLAFVLEVVSIARDENVRWQARSVRELLTQPPQ